MAVLPRLPISRSIKLRKPMQRRRRRLQRRRQRAATSKLMKIFPEERRVQRHRRRRQKFHLCTKQPLILAKFGSTRLRTSLPHVCAFTAVDHIQPETNCPASCIACPRRPSSLSRTRHQSSLLPPRCLKEEGEATRHNYVDGREGGGGNSIDFGGLAAALFSACLPRHMRRRAESLLVWHGCEKD